MQYDTDHARFRDDIGAYVAGGLTDAERRAFEAHAAECNECAVALADMVAEENHLNDLFAGARPRIGLEDRIVGYFQAQARHDYRRLRIHLHPAVRRAAIGVAAAVMLGGFGFVASQTINNRGLPTPWAASVSTGQALRPSDREERPGAVVHYGQLAIAVPSPASPAEMARSFNDSLASIVTNGRSGGEQTVPGQKRARGLAAEVRNEVLQDGVQPVGDQNKPQIEDHVAFQKTPLAPMKPGGGGSGGGAGAAEYGFRDNVYSFGVLPQSGSASSTTPAPAPEPAAADKGGQVDTLAKLRAAVPAAEADEKKDTKLGLSYRGFKPADAQSWGVRFDDDLDVKANVNGQALGERVLADGTPPANAPAAQADQQAQARGREGQPVQDAGPPTRVTEPAAANPAPQPPPAAPANSGRKVIRNGDMSFEVDSFDSSYLQITKIAAEEGGFVATTDSEKLANGKVRGVVTVRVPPERLDTLVLKLRGLGELKSSKIAAQDITKQYTDLESQLRAARAMEERLLNVIKTGKGTIKELVEAEKQLGVYREKIEHVEGEIRYYNNLVSLSTLNVTLTERDIRTAALLSETETVNMGVEADDVEKARAAAIKAIEEAKGRIVESDLKKLEAGQFAARVVADVPPDAAGPLIDRMRQVGAVARLEVARKQTTPEGSVAPAQGAAALPRVERRDTRFLISLYNLANVAPRQTTTLNLAAEDVEVAYRMILDQVKSAGGRVVASQLNRPRPDQTTGTVTFEAPADKADVLLGAVRGNGEVMRLDVNQNPDTQNVTETKRGFALQIFSLASVAPRETTTLRVAARGVPDAFNKLRDAVRTTQRGRVLSSQLAEQESSNVTGTVDFEVRRDDWPAIETALRETGQVVSRNVSRSSDTENTVDSKIRLQVTLVDEAALAPRESVTIQLAVADVPAQYSKLLEALGTAQARVLQSQLNEQETRNNVTATLAFDVRRDNRAAVDKALAEAGDVVSRNVTRSTDTQNTLDDKVRISLSVADADRLPPRETTTLGMEARDVEAAKEAIESLALGLGGRVVDSTLSRETNGRVIAKVVADVPLGKAMEMVSKTRGQGRVQFRRDARDENVPAGLLSRYRVDVTLANEELIVAGGQGLATRIREGLRTSVTGLLWSVQLIVIGLFLVAPWALIIWFAWRLLRRGRGRKPATTTPVPA